MTVDFVCGCFGSAMVSCIFCHRGVQLIFAYSWARPAILVAGKGREVMFFISSVSSLSFLFLFLPCPSLSFLLLSLLSLFTLSLGDDTKWPTRVDVSLNPNSINVLGALWSEVWVVKARQSRRAEASEEVRGVKKEIKALRALMGRLSECRLGKWSCTGTKNFHLTLNCL